MSKKQKPKPEHDVRRIQTDIPADLAKRFYASPEYQLHRNVSTALRAILARALPKDEQCGPEPNLAS